MAVLIGVYVLAPLDREPNGVSVLGLLLALLVFIAVIAWQIVVVTRSSYPGLRAAEIVGVSVPALILLFAATYVLTINAQSDSFTEPMTRLDAIYFTVTVFATVGFGDIAPRSETARALVTLQMLADLALIGVIAKVLFGAVRHRREALDADTTHTRD